MGRVKWRKNTKANPVAFRDGESIVRGAGAPDAGLGPLHPQARSVVEGIPRIWFELENMTAACARQYSPVAGTDPIETEGVSVESIEIDSPAGSVPGRIYRPTFRSGGGMLLWLRGGGFIMGSAASERIHGPLAAASGCTVVSIDYRLAPEHRYPAALEDCYAALCWMAEYAACEENGTNEVGIGGDSAGGNLAAAVTLLARDRQTPPPALQVLLYPMLARHFRGSRQDPSVSPIAAPAAIDWLWEQYAGGAQQSEELASDPYASPLSAVSLSHLPAAIVITAEYDLLRDEGRAYADRLIAEDVPVEYREYLGVHHGFADSPGVIDAADSCISFLGSSIRSRLRPR